MMSYQEAKGELAKARQLITLGKYPEANAMIRWAVRAGHLTPNDLIEQLGAENIAAMREWAIRRGDAK